MSEALCRAAQTGQTAFVLKLLDRGDDVDAAEDDNITALMLAAEGGHIGATPLMVAAFCRTINDRQPWLIAARDRVLEWMVSTQDAWTVCGERCHRRGLDAEEHGARTCPACLRIGYRHVRVPDTTSSGGLR